MRIDKNSFETKYDVNLRHDDFIHGLYYQIQIKFLKDPTSLYAQLISVSTVREELSNSYPNFIIVREETKLFQIRKDGSRVQLWAFENNEVPIESILENYRCGIV